MNKKLKDILKSIDQSKYMLDLKSNWNDEGACEIDIVSFDRAIFGLLLRYAIYFNTYKNKILKTPEINPVKDGSIDLVWKTDTHRLLINISKNKASFYGDNYDNQDKIKSNINIESDNFTPILENDLSKWMLSHLTY